MNSAGRSAGAGARQIVVVRALTEAERRPPAMRRPPELSSITVRGKAHGIAAQEPCCKCSQLAAKAGCNGRSATCSSFTQRNSALSPLGTVVSNSGASAMTVV